MVFTVADDSAAAVSVTVTVSFIHFILNRQIKFGRDSCSRSSRFITGAGAPLSLVKLQDNEGVLTSSNIMVLISDAVDLPCLLPMEQWREESPCPFLPSV